MLKMVKGISSSESKGFSLLLIEQLRAQISCDLVRLLQTYLYFTMCWNISNASQPVSPKSEYCRPT